jgi:hypothetical protein
MEHLQQQQVAEVKVLGQTLAPSPVATQADLIRLGFRAETVGQPIAQLITLIVQVMGIAVIPAPQVEPQVTLVPVAMELPPEITDKLVVVGVAAVQKQVLVGAALEFWGKALAVQLKQLTMLVVLEALEVRKEATTTLK